MAADSGLSGALLVTVATALPRVALPLNLGGEAIDFASRLLAAFSGEADFIWFSMASTSFCSPLRCSCKAARFALAVRAVTDGEDLEVVALEARLLEVRAGVTATSFSSSSGL